MKYPVAPPERIYLSALGERVKNACLVGFLDHVILASNGSTSFMERGLMPRG